MGADTRQWMTSAEYRAAFVRAGAASTEATPPDPWDEPEDTTPQHTPDHRVVLHCADCERASTEATERPDLLPDIMRRLEAGRRLDTSEAVYFMDEDVEKAIRAALTAEATERPALLDVERLARAMRSAWPVHREGSGGTGDVAIQSWDVLDPAYPSDGLATRIAAEYAALTGATPPSEPQENGDD